MEHMENAQISGTVTIDGAPENQFRRAIEAMLREGRADEAARRLKDELVFLCGEGLPLPARFRFISAQDVSVTGWPRMLERIAELDRPGDPITALSLDICLAPLAAADAENRRPFYETSYYTDRAWPFSRAARADLALACGSPAWQGSAEDNDDRLQLSGLEDLHIVIAAIEALCLRGMATIEEQRAFIVGACYLAVLSHQAVRDAAMAEGLPRSMAVIVGSDGTYPAFEAAALAAGEGRAHGTGVEDASAPPHGPAHTSLGHHEVTEPFAPTPPTEAWHLPPPGIHVTGTQLRHRLVTRESIAELEAETSPSLLNRVFGGLLRKK
ncbi:hypothetical protein NTCA1_01210 [Novosphingobium sp. TCA1]|nr:hypothetical protein NTCA1_01210 [Novosphingobium sp. TCA1]